ncbi:MAG: hypothetical protein ACO1RT_13175 [Planctomycetaceae bacterium]
MLSPVTIAPPTKIGTMEKVPPETLPALLVVFRPLLTTVGEQVADHRVSLEVRLAASDVP